MKLVGLLILIFSFIQNGASLTCSLTDSACGDTKGCFRDSAWLITWQDNGGNCIDMEIFGTSDYVAMGISDDQAMGDDSVLACTNNGGTAKIYNSYNSGRTNDVFSVEAYGITTTEIGVISGCVVCRFCRSKTHTIASGRRKKRAVAADDGTFKDMNLDYYVLVATGSQSGGYITVHSSIPTVSSIKADFQSFQDLSAADIKYPMVKAHGCLMQFAWVMFASIGIVVAFYMKEEWADHKIFGEKVWFQIHRLCMVMVFVLTNTSFIIIFVYVKGYSDIDSDKRLQEAHPVLGIMVMALVVVNLTMGILRPKPDAKYRIVFNVCHTVVGVLAMLLATLCIFGGISFEKSSVPDAGRFVMFGYVAWYIFVQVVLMCIDCFRGKRGYAGKVNSVDNSAGKEDYPMEENNLENPNKTNNEKENDFNMSRIKEIIFYVHVVIVVGFAVAIVIITAVN